MSQEFSLRCKELNQFALDVLLILCPGGQINGQEFEAASVNGGMGKSFKYNLTTGLWSDFAENGLSGSDLVSFVAASKNIEQFQALEWLESQFNPDQSPENKIVKKSYDLIFTLVPKGTQYPSFDHKKYGRPHEVYVYENANNQVCFYIAKYIHGSEKEFIPFSYSIEGKWINKAWTKNRPIFNLKEILKRPNDTVVIVEGEKAALAGAKFLHNYAVVAWSGGAQAYSKTDWSHLAGKKVILWPDADRKINKKTGKLYAYQEQPGIAAMLGLKSVLDQICESVQIINVGIDESRHDGWDAADAYDDGWDENRFLEFLNKKNELSETKKQILSFNHFDIVKNKIKPLSTIDNLQALLDFYGITVRNNCLSKKEEILIPDQSFGEEGKENAQLAYIKSIAGIHSFPIAQIEEFLKYIANKNQYNPVVTWVKSVPWDKMSRLGEFYSTVVAKDENENKTTKTLKETFIKRWMISAIAGAFNHSGVAAQGVLVFQGEQNLGKTEWLKALAPAELKFAKDGMSLKLDDKDSVMQALSFWLVELGEVDHTFRKSDISNLKAFISKDSDTFRVPFARRESTYPRRTVFFASVNPRQYLQDETGNRRYWTIECESVNFKHGLDMQQIWAEIYEDFYLKGEKWFLTKDEILLLNEHNEDFKSLDPIEELVLERLDWSYLPHAWSEKTVTEILIECGKNNPTRLEINNASNIIKKMNGGKVRRKNSGRYLSVPPLKSNYQKNQLF